MVKPQLTIIGHISKDQIENLHGIKAQPGGAALYSAMGARLLPVEVRLISSVGRDFEEVNLIANRFPGSILKRVALPTTRFEIQYNRENQAHYKKAELGAGAAIRVADLPLHWIREGVFIHLAPMRPEKVERFVEQIRRVNGKVWVSAHTNLMYLESSRTRKILRRLGEMVDLLILNDQEALALSESRSLLSALQVRAKRLAITLGPVGAIVVEGERFQMIPALSGLTPNPKDTTGAGDVWAGALLAAYALTGEWTRSVVTACIASALKCMDWGFRRIQDLRFNTPEDAVKYVLSLRDGTMQLTIKDFI